MNICCKTRTMHQMKAKISSLARYVCGFIGNLGPNVIICWKLKTMHQWHFFILKSDEIKVSSLARYVCGFTGNLGPNVIIWRVHNHFGVYFYAGNLTQNLSDKVKTKWQKMLYYFYGLATTWFVFILATWGPDFPKKC